MNTLLPNESRKPNAHCYTPCERRSKSMENDWKILEGAVEHERLPFILATHSGSHRSRGSGKWQEKTQVVDLTNSMVTD